MSLGPVMLDVLGTELTPGDVERLKHPLTGGVILFSRNYQSPSQLAQLTAAIHAVRTPPLLIAVDHEGGRVQRFREGFTRIPAMREFGKLWAHSPQQARQLAEQTGFVLAAELRAHGVDFSFAPVLDIDYGESSVIGDRSFHRSPQAISELAHSLLSGMKHAGMGAVGKHFPGHGFVRADSHLEVPVDERDLADIEMDDLIPFRRLTEYGMTGVMPAHVIYPKEDTLPAGFSDVWLKDILRKQLGFDGVIFSDDLSMEGASVAGGVVQRAEAALSAGCDMVLVCNDAGAADTLLSGLTWQMPAVGIARLVRMHGKPNPLSMVKLHEDPYYASAVHSIASIGLQSAELPFDPSNTCGNN